MSDAETAEFTADDVYAPRILYVSSLTGNCVRVHFDQEVDQTTSEFPGNLYFDYPAISITSVTCEGSTVLIEAAALVFGSTYNIYARDIEDTNGNAMLDEVSSRFVYASEVPAPEIGLWSDLDRYEDFVQASPFQPFEFYVWCRPGPNGLYLVAYALAERSIFEFEYGIINVEENPDVVLSANPSGNWTLFDVVANANGCDGGGRNSICAMVDPLHTLSVTSSETFQWVFDVTYESYVPTDEDAAIRAWFVQCLDAYECGNAGLMSLRTSVPEPGTLGMLGVGLVLLGVARRRPRVAA